MADKNTFNDKINQAAYKQEYVYFGHFPQTIKPRGVIIGEQVEPTVYKGSDGNLYCNERQNGKYTVDRCTMPGVYFKKSGDCRYSDGQREGEYFKIEPIKWRVIHRGQGVLLLMSDSILFYSRYAVRTNPLKSTGGAWDTSHVRKVLNNEFFNAAFSQEERDMMLTHSVNNDSDHLNLAERMGNTVTKDKVFILSRSNINLYDFNKADLPRRQTDFCGPSVDYSNPNRPERINIGWMTRTSCGEVWCQDNKDIVKTYVVDMCGTVTTMFFGDAGVAPVIRVYEEDVDIYRDGELISAKRKSKKKRTNVEENEEEKGKMSLGEKIGATIASPVLWLVGLIIAAFITSGGLSVWGQIVGLAYVVLCEVIIWVKKRTGLVFLLVALNLVVGLVTGLTMTL